MDAQEAKKWLDIVDDCEGMVTFKHGTIYMPMLIDGKWVDSSLAEILAAHSAQVEAELRQWKDAATGCQSPRDLDILLDRRVGEILGGDTRMGDALAELAEQGQDMNLADKWQNRAEAAEAELVKLREALREAINFIEETADGMCVIGQETNCSRAAKPIYKKLSAFYEALGETGPEETK